MAKAPKGAPRKSGRPPAPKRRATASGAGRGSGLVVGLTAAAGTLGLFLIAALAGLWFVYLGPGPSARDGDVTVVSLPSGSGVSTIAANLKQAGVIRSSDVFKAAATLTGADRKLRAGEYEVKSGTSLHGVIRLLVDGKVVRHYVTIPEGWSSAQAVDILMKQPVLTGEVTEIPAEGALWPETYEVMRGDTRASVIARMKRARDENLARLWEARGQNLVVRTPEEAVILASVVEKETGLAEERPRVAAVFANRLRLGMRLESDPTIVYGITKGRPLGRGIRLSELRAPTPWNTYTIDGLPPTPIANPGKDAIVAVLNPPRTDDLFFVADGTGGHAFARTYQEHLLNVSRWREVERQRAAAAGQTETIAPETSPAPMTGEAAPDDGPSTGVAVITMNPGARP